MQDFKNIYDDLNQSNVSLETIASIEALYLENKKLKAEQELSLTNKMNIFDSIIKQLPLSIIVTDHQANIIYVNERFEMEMGYMSYELIGKNPKILRSTHTERSEYENLWHTIKSGDTWYGIFKNITKHKEAKWMATIVSPIFNEDKITNFIAIESNIDEKIKLEEKLKKQEDLLLVQSRLAAMGEMISIIAHQWRQPLSLISTIASSISFKSELNILDPEEDLKDLNQIVSTTRYLSDTIDDFRHFFKEDKKIEKESIKAIFEKVISIQGKSLENNLIDIEIDAQSTKKINTYPKELVQVFLNIINNAKDALVSKDLTYKKIYINIFEVQESTVIEIGDNAGGIPEDIIDKVFEPYFTTKGPKSGTGLGLYISKIIIEKHLEGTIRVENSKGGALFTIILDDLLL